MGFLSFLRLAHCSEGAIFSLLWIWITALSYMITPVSLAWRLSGRTIKHVVKKNKNLQYQKWKVVCHPLLHLPTDWWLCCWEGKTTKMNCLEGTGGQSSDFSLRFLSSLIYLPYLLSYLLSLSASASKVIVTPSLVVLTAPPPWMHTQPWLVQLPSLTSSFLWTQFTVAHVFNLLRVDNFLF